MSQYADARYVVYDETERRARKAHVCDACGDPILPGHRYFVVKWVFDGSADGVKRCLGCQATHLHLRAVCHETDSEMWPSERLDCGEEYTDHWGKPPPEHIARLAFLSPAEKQALVFHVFRNQQGDHFVAETAEAAGKIAAQLGLDDAVFPVPGDVGIPVIVDGAERFLFRHIEHDDVRYPQTLYQDGFHEMRQPHTFRSALEWAVECGTGLLCSGAPVPPLQGPLRKRGMWN